MAVDLATLKVSVQADTSHLTKLSTELKRADRSAADQTKSLSKLRDVMQAALKRAEAYSHRIEIINRTSKVGAKQLAEHAAAAARLNTSIFAGVRTLTAWERAAAKTTTAANKQEAANKKVQASFAKMHGTINSLNGVMAGLGLGFVGRELIRVGNSFDRVRITLNTITGDAGAARNAFGFLQKTARDLGVNFLSLTDSYGQLAAATRNTSLEGEAMRKIFTGVAKTAAVMRWDIENTRGVMKAFEQMISKGTVQAEELRNQLGDRMPQAMGIFVRAFHGLDAAVVVSSEKMQKYRMDFNKAMKAGKVDAETTLPRVAELLEQVFGPGVAAASRSAFAEINRMNNAFQNLADAAWVAGLGQAIANIARGLTQMFESQRMIQFVEVMSAGFGRLTQILLDNGNALSGLLIAMTAFISSAIVIQIFNVAKAFLAVGGGVSKVTSLLALLSAGAGVLFTVLGGGGSGVADAVEKTAEATGKLDKTAMDVGRSFEFMTATAETMNDTMDGGTDMAAVAKMLERVREANAALAKTTEETTESFFNMKNLGIAGMFLAIGQGVKYLIPQLSRAKDLALSLVAATAAAARSGSSGAGGWIAGTTGASRNVSRQFASDFGIGSAFKLMASESDRAAKKMMSMSASGKVMARTFDVLVAATRGLGAAFAATFAFLGGWPAVITAAAVAVGYMVYQHYAAIGAAEEYMRALAAEGSTNEEIAKSMKGTANERADFIDKTVESINKQIKAEEDLFEVKNKILLQELNEKRAKFDSNEEFLASSNPNSMDRGEIAAIAQTVKQQTELNKRIQELDAMLGPANAKLASRTAGLRNSATETKVLADETRQYGNISAEAAEELAEFEKRLDRKNRNRELSDMELMIERIDEIKASTVNLNKAESDLLDGMRAKAVAEDKRLKDLEASKDLNQDLKSGLDSLTDSYRRHYGAVELLGKSEQEQIEIQARQDIGQEADDFLILSENMRKAGKSQEEINAATEMYRGIILGIAATRDKDVQKLNDQTESVEKYTGELRDELKYIGRNAEEQEKLNLEKKIDENLTKARKIALDAYNRTHRGSIDLTEEEIQKIREVTTAEHERIKARDLLIEQQKEMDSLWEDFAEDFDNIGKDLFSNLTTNGKSAWGNMLDDMKDATGRMFGELVSMGVMQPLNGAVRSFMGGTGSLGNVGRAASIAGSVTGQAAGGLAGNGVGTASLLANLAMGGGGRLFGSSTGYALFNGMQGIGMSAGVSSSLVGGLQASPWGAVGGVGANLLGLGGGTGGAVGGMVGSVAGGAVGTALFTALGSAAGPVGAILGSFLGTAIGGMLQSRPSDRTQGSHYDPATKSWNVTGFTGAKFSQENWDASDKFAETLRGFQERLESSTGGRVSSSGVMAEFGDRDGLRITGIGGYGSQTFADSEAGFRAVAEHFIANLTGVSEDVTTAIAHMNDSMSLERRIELLDFASGFSDAIEAMEVGSLDVAQVTRLAAREQIREITAQIRDFKAETAAAGLDTGRAASATRAYVEQLVGIREAIAPESPMAQAWQNLIGVFEEIGPLLQEVGINADEASTLLAQAQGRIRAGFDASIQDRLLQVRNPGAYGVQQLLNGQASDLADAATVGGNSDAVRTLYSSLIGDSLSGMDVTQLNSIRAYFSTIPQVTAAVDAAIAAIAAAGGPTTTAGQFDNEINRRYLQATNSGAFSILELIEAQADDLAEATRTGGSTAGVSNLYGALINNVLQGMSLEDLNDVKEYFAGIGAAAGPINAAIQEVINGIDAQLIAEAAEKASAAAKAAADFNLSIREQIDKLKDPMRADEIDLNAWLRGAVADAIASGGDVGQVIELYNLKRVNEASQERVSTLQDEISVIEDSIDTWGRLAKTLTQARVGFQTDPELSPDSPAVILANLRGQFEDAVTRSGSIDDTIAGEAMEELPDLSQRLLEASRRYYASSAGYLADFNRVQEALLNTSTVALNELTIAQTQLSTQQGILAQLQAGIQVFSNGTGGSTPIPPPPPVQYSTADLASNNSSYSAAMASYKAPSAQSPNGRSDAEWIASSQFQNFITLRDMYLDGLKNDAASKQYLTDSWAWLKNSGQKNDPVWGSVGEAYQQVLLRNMLRLGMSNSTFPHFADGGMAEPGIKLVGERGPELMMSGSARFFNASKTSEMLSSSNNNMTSTINDQTVVMSAGFTGMWDRLDQVNRNLTDIRRELKKAS